MLPVHLRKERLALALVFFALGMVFASWAARIPELKEHLRLTDGQLGISMFWLACGSLVSMPLTAALAHRFGSGRVTIIGSIGFAAALLLLPIANSWLLFSVVLFVFGFAMGSQDVSMNAHAVEVERAFNRSIMSAFHGMFSVGAMVGGALGAFVCMLPVAPINHFVLVAGVVVPTMAVAGRYLVKPSSAEQSSKSETAPVFALPRRGIWVAAAIAFCSFVCEGMVSDWGAVYLDDVLHSGPSLAAAGFSVFSLAMAVCRFTGDWLINKLGSARILLVGSLISAFSLAGSLITSAPLAVLGCYLFAGVGLSCIVPIAFSAAGRNHQVPASVAIASVATAGYFGFIIAPPIIGLLADHLTLRTALWLAVLLCLTISGLSQMPLDEETN